MNFAWQQSHVTMNTFLWVLQVFAAVVFTYSGLMKSTKSREYLVSIGQTGVDGLSYPVIRFIAIAELLGVIGLIVPCAANIAPVLTPMAATGFCIIMLIAAPIHYSRGEMRSIGVNVMLFLICAVIAFMRFRELVYG
jgi:uncharacterized membrane protein YphA (DoxX/SURF4 family)